MSTITIHYSNIEASILEAKKTASALGDYSSHMNDIASRCSSLGGSEYVNTAAEKARQKALTASQEQIKFITLAKELKDLEEFTKDTDSKVANHIDMEISKYVGKRGFFYKLFDSLREMYTCFLDRIASIPLVGKSVSNFLRSVDNDMRSLVRNIYNYFKYGDGKYIWNSVKAVTGVLVAIAGLVLAAAAAITAAPALVIIGIIGVIAGCVALVLQFGDMMATVDRNMRAYELATEYHRSTDIKTNDNWWNTQNDTGSLSYARYYGNVNDLKGYFSTIDFGDKKVNNVMSIVGIAYDALETVAQITSTVCTVAASIGNAQYLKDINGDWVKNAKGEVVKRHGGFFENIITSYCEDFGYTYKRTPVRQQISRHYGKKIVESKNANKMLEFKMFKGYAEKFTKYGIKVSKGERIILEGSKHFQTIQKTFSRVDKISKLSKSKDADFDDYYDAVEAFHGLAKNTNAVDSFTSDFGDSVGTVHDAVELIKELFWPDTNAYAAYLAANP